MARIEGVCKSVVDKAEWVAIGTAGSAGAHLSATWGDYVRALSDVEGDRLLIPVGGMGETERNLLSSEAIELLFATRQVQGSHGPGQGCKVRGRGRVQSTGEDFERAKRSFPWARAVLLVTVDEAKEQL